MLIPISGLLTAQQILTFRQTLQAADWIDGRVTAGHQAVKVKRNRQLPEDHPAARELGETIVAALGRSAVFISAALPLRVFPPLFNRYEEGETFGTHIDTAIRQVTGTPHRVRTDLSATLFLAEPSEYDGGELIVEDTYGIHTVKLPAGDLILYPASSRHHVRPVTRGARLAAFFWIQSMVRDDGERAILLDLDLAIQAVARDNADHPAGVQLTGVYHNLLRRWADV